MSKQILLLEDAEDQANLIRRALERNSGKFNVKCVPTLSEGRRLLNERSWDLVLAEFRLPDGLGTELLSEEEFAFCPPVVILTGHGDQSTAVEALKAGALDYVVKSPENLADMSHIAEQALREWSYVLERAEKDEALRESESRYRMLFETMQDGFALCELLYDAYGVPCDVRFLEVNPAFETMLEIPTNASLSQTALQLIPGLDEEIFERFGKVLDSGESIRFEYNLEEREKHFEIMAFRPRSGQFAILIEDTTERAKLQDRLRHSEKMEAIGQLAGGVAHDFNNQLACIMGFADLLRNKLTGDKKLQRYAGTIVKAANRSSELTKQLLAFARKGQYKTVDIDAHELIHEIVLLLEHSLNKRVQISCVFDSQQAFINGDPNQLQNALLNIAINADAAMPQGGKITFHTEDVTLDDASCRQYDQNIEAGDYLKISISDTGTGMSESTRSRIFEPFFTTKPAGEGTGMGLAAVYGTVCKHNGAIVLETAIGEGSTFRILFPRVDPINEEEEEQLNLLDKQCEGNIMLVDDEEHVRDMGEALLGELGYTVFSFANGNEAIKFFETEHDVVDLAVLDMNMPGLSGKETFTKMREIRPDAKVVLTSGYSIEGDIREALEEGAVDFLRKPFNALSLMVLMEEVLSGKQLMVSRLRPPGKDN